MGKFIGMIVLSLLVGILLTGLTTLWTVEYHMSGPGYGFPFSILHPATGDAGPANTYLEKWLGSDIEVDFESFFINLGFWTLMAPMVLYLLGAAFAGGGKKEANRDWAR